MSEPLAASLSKFTPDASGLDRDALLFAAGRASVRPNRGWMALAGALVASQLATLAYLSFPSASPFVGSTPTPAHVVAPTPVPHEELSPDRDAPSYWPLREQALAAEGDLPAPRSVEQLAPALPPLHAFAVPPSALLQ